MNKFTNPKEELEHLIRMLEDYLSSTTDAYAYVQMEEMLNRAKGWHYDVCQLYQKTVAILNDISDLETKATLLREPEYHEATTVDQMEDTNNSE